MGLLGSGFRETKTGKFFGSSILNGANPPTIEYNRKQAATLRNSVSALGSMTGIPSGYRHPGAWVMPQKPGALSASTPVSFSMTGGGQLGKNAVTSIPLSMAISQAAMGLVTGGVSTISIGFTITPPSPAGVLLASTSFTGVGFTVTSVLGAKSGLGSTLTMTFTPVATARAKGFIAATISGEGEEVTPNSVANAVWEAFMVAHNNAGTMGQAMNAAGGAADPWLTALPGSYLAGTAGSIIGTMEANVNAHTDAAVAAQEALLELSSFGGEVHIDATDGTAGTAYPLGTHDHPVDNMIDALAICYANGFGELNVKNALTIIASNVIDNFKIKSDSWPAVTLNTGVEMENAVFERVSLYGEFEGYWNTINDCWVYDITNFSGWIRGGSIGSVALSVGLGAEFGGQCFFDNIVPLFPGVPSEIIANTNSEISITNSTDLMVLKSMTTGCVAYIGLSGGTITIDASCTGGTIVVSGVGTLVNESALNVNSSGLATTFDAAVDGVITLAEAIRLQNSVLAGKVSGAGSGTEIFRDLADTKNRVTSTVDASGNRTAVTVDGS